MGSSLRRFSGTTLNMYKLALCSFLALAAAAPLEDTAEVAAAKEAFNAAFAAAKAAFLAAFDDAAAGGLAAKQAPAPVHVLPEPAPLVAAPVASIVAAPAIAYAGLHHAAYPY